MRILICFITRKTFRYLPEEEIIIITLNRKYWTTVDDLHSILFEIRKSNRTIGHIKVQFEFDRRTLQIVDFKIDEKLRGKGYGTYAFTILRSYFPTSNIAGMVNGLEGLSFGNHLLREFHIKEDAWLKDKKNSSYTQTFLIPAKFENEELEMNGGH